jgi:hypothetical protein
MRCCLLAICLSASRREAISGGALVFTEADWNFITQFPFSSIARVPVFPKLNFLIGKLSSPRYIHALKKLLESFGSSF